MGLRHDYGSSLTAEAKVKRILVAGLLGGLVIFIWGAVSWMVLPFHNASYRPLPNGEAVAAALQANVTEKGMYYYPPEPADDAPNAMEQWRARWMRGPVVTQLMYLPRGEDPMMVAAFVNFFLYAIIAATLVAWMLRYATASLGTTTRRIGFVAAIGAITALLGPLTEGNWFHQPGAYVLGGVVDCVVGWTLVGVLFARLLRATPDVVPSYSPMMAGERRTTTT